MMSFHRLVSSGLELFLLLLLTSGSQGLMAEPMTPAGQPSGKALILYDGPSTGYSEGLISARGIANLLGHFSIGYQIQPLESYQKGLLENYRWTFFAGNIENTQVPKRLLE